MGLFIHQRHGGIQSLVCPAFMQGNHLQLGQVVGKCSVFTWFCCSAIMNAFLWWKKDASWNKLFKDLELKLETWAALFFWQLVCYLKHFSILKSLSFLFQPQPSSYNNRPMISLDAKVMNTLLWTFPLNSLLLEKKNNCMCCRVDSNRQNIQIVLLGAVKCSKMHIKKFQMQHNVYIAVLLQLSLSKSNISDWHELYQTYFRD
jgi:hypothetical protein